MAANRSDSHTAVSICTGIDLSVEPANRCFAIRWVANTPTGKSVKRFLQTTNGIEKPLLPIGHRFANLHRTVFLIDRFHGAHLLM